MGHDLTDISAVADIWLRITEEIYGLTIGCFVVRVKELLREGKLTEEEVDRIGEELWNIRIEAQDQVRRLH